MFSRHTADAILALAAIDAAVTERERRLLESLLAGDGAESISGKCLSFREAASLLGRTTLTVKRLAKAGRLSAVMGSGRRAIGVTAESLDALLRGRGGSQVADGEQRKTK